MGIDFHLVTHIPKLLHNFRLAARGLRRIRKIAVQPLGCARNTKHTSWSWSQTVSML